MMSHYYHSHIDISRPICRTGRSANHCYAEQDFTFNIEWCVNVACHCGFKLGIVTITNATARAPTIVKISTVTDCVSTDHGSTCCINSSADLAKVCSVVVADVAASESAAAAVVNADTRSTTASYLRFGPTVAWYEVQRDAIQVC